jgi:hypothetical protein
VDYAFSRRLELSACFWPLYELLLRAERFFSRGGAGARVDPSRTLLGHLVHDSVGKYAGVALSQPPPGQGGAAAGADVDAANARAMQRLRDYYLNTHINPGFSRGFLAQRQLLDLYHMQVLSRYATTRAPGDDGTQDDGGPVRANGHQRYANEVLRSQALLYGVRMFRPRLYSKLKERKRATPAQPDGPAAPTRGSALARPAPAGGWLRRAAAVAGGPRPPSSAAPGGR